MNLFDYQKEAVIFAQEKRKIYIALDMGMGKTLTAIASAVGTTRKNILVVAELNEIQNSQNFKKEVENNFPKVQYQSLRESKAEELGLLVQTVYGINPDSIDKIPAGIAETIGAVIMDEATLAKTTTTDRFKKVKAICDRVDFVFLLSGTPMLNGAAEIYSPLLLLGHELAGKGDKKAQMAFEKIFAGGCYRQIRSIKGVSEAQLKTQWWKYYSWWAKGANNVRELRWLIRDRFFFKRKDQTNVFKKKDRHTVFIPWNTEWEAEYNQAWDEYLESVNEYNLTAEKSERKNIENIKDLQKLIENGKVYQVNSRWKAKKIVADIKAGLYEDHRIIIWTVYVETEKILQEELTAADISFKTFEELPNWKEGTEKVLVGKIKSHAKGGNAYEASCSLFVDMDFVPTMNIQAENRMDRPEQKRDMIVRYYMTKEETVDQHVQKINRDKMRKIEEFLRPFTKEEEAEMPGKIAELQKKFSTEFRILGLDF